MLLLHLALYYPLINAIPIVVSNAIILILLDVFVIPVFGVSSFSPVLSVDVFVLVSVSFVFFVSCYYIYFVFYFCSVFFNSVYN